MGELTPMASYATGSMNSLLHKLTQLKSPPKIIQLYKDLQIFLKEDVNKLVELPGEAEDVQVWLKQVRHIVFDIEDYIDLGQPRLSRIKDFIAQIREARKRCKRYNLLLKVNIANDLGDFRVRPHQLVARDEAELFRLVDNPVDLVGLDGPIRELTEHLGNKDECKKLKVVSIVGPAGIGKTTLAKKLYEYEPIQRKAFVDVSRKNLSIKAIVHSILDQIKPQEVVSTESQNEQEVIAELWKQLSRNRYFIVLDGMWSIRAWSIISCTFPDNDSGSRILITTRIKEVAKSCSQRRTDVVHDMQPLSNANSNKLFHSVISSVDHVSKKKDKYSVDKIEGFVELCYGVPLAITVGAGLFTTSDLTLEMINRLLEIHSASHPKYVEQAQQKILRRREVHSALDPKSVEQAQQKIVRLPEVHSASHEKHIERSQQKILRRLEVLSTPDQLMRNILAISYDNLCLPLKSCFLYLGIFPADYTIQKDRLIRLWSTEGFIPTRRAQSLWETGERYFHELICMRLIKPVFSKDEDYRVVSGCTVNGMILDFIRSLSSKENFVTMASELDDGPFPCYSIRRFSIDCSKKEEVDMFRSVRLSSARSLTFHGDIVGVLDHPSKPLSFTRFKLTRVLDFGDCSNLEDRHLEGIGALVILGHLGLGGTGILKLPEEIGDLLRLQTLDVRRTKLTSLPASVARLPKLAHLLVEPGVQLPCVTWLTPELEEVGTITVNDAGSGKSVIDLLECSPLLKVLSLNFGAIYGHAVSNSHEIWTFIRSLEYLCHGLELQRFELSLSTTSSRSLQHLSSLESVTHLHIKVPKLDAYNFMSLDRLDKLVLLLKKN